MSGARTALAGGKRGGISCGVAAGTFRMWVAAGWLCFAAVAAGPGRDASGEPPPGGSGFAAAGTGGELSPDHLPGAKGMTRLLSVRFDAGRPKLTPEEEAGIHRQTAAPGFQEITRAPAATLIVVGYIDHGGGGGELEDAQTAFRRAQMVIDLLRDRCGVSAVFQAATLEVARLPAREQDGKQRLVEVWIVDP